MTGVVFCVGAMAQCQSKMCCLSRRHREQARSHMGSAMPAKFKSPPQIPVGASLLAKVVGQLASMPDVPTHSRASSFPQKSLWVQVGGVSSRFSKVSIRAGPK
ncbi:hypothetical protein ACJ6X8_09620, partial [Pseudomonas alvandae]